MFQIQYTTEKSLKSSTVRFKSCNFKLKKNTEKNAPNQLQKNKETLIVKLYYHRFPIKKHRRIKFYQKKLQKLRKNKNLN